MQKFEPMSIDDRLALAKKAFECLDAGDEAGYSRYTRQMPMPTYLAKIMKDKMGADFLIKGGWNLTEVEAELGPDWLSR